LFLALVIPLTLAIAISVTTAFSGAFKMMPPAPKQLGAIPQVNQAVPSEPVRLLPYTLAQSLLPPGQVQAALDRLRITKPTSVSALLHAARLYGLDMPVPKRVNQPESVPFRALLFDHNRGQEVFRGEPALIPTRDGVRSRVVIRRDSFHQPERQAHSGQLLAVLAEQGVSLDTPLTLETGRYTVRDILADTVANFCLDDAEIEWAAVALSLYLPPQTEWKDKFGRRTTFNQLAERLMEIPFARAGLACQGTHLLQALTVSYAVDRQRSILSPSVRDKVRRHLETHVRELIESQRQTGQWTGGWYNPKAGQAVVRLLEGQEQMKMAVTVTGHHLEWLLIVPPDLRPPDEVFRRAGLWLHAALLRATPEELAEGYCPYSHAGYVVKVLSSPLGQTARGSN
jgi:hypothetical protein